MRRSVSKMQSLEAHHTGLCEKVHAMFAEDWPAAAIKRMIQTTYGERISITTLEKYKSRHWRGLRDQVQQAKAALANTAGEESAPAGTAPQGAAAPRCGERSQQRAAGSARPAVLEVSRPTFIWRFGPEAKSTRQVIGSGSAG